jgi:hypothetical protein
MPSARDGVDVRCLVADYAEAIGADVELADVVADDDEDVRTSVGWRRLGSWARAAPTIKQTGGGMALSGRFDVASVQQEQPFR